MDRQLFTTLIACTFALLLLYLLYSITAPFLGMLIWAGAISITTSHLHEKLLARCGGKQTMTAMIMTTSVFLSVIIPIIAVMLALSQEAAYLYRHLENAAYVDTTLPALDLLKQPLILDTLEKMDMLARRIGLDLHSMIVSATKKALGVILDYSTDILKNFFSFFFKLMLMVVTLFFFYRDGKSFVSRIWSLIHTGAEHKKSVNMAIKRILKGVLCGIILTSVIQGILGGVGFWLAGLPSPLLFGAIMTVCAVIPVVGTSLVWLPGVLYLLLQGQILYGVLLLAWCLAIVSSVDNIIRPVFISGMARIHMLAMIFGVLGGLLAFGFTGIVAGPVILAMPFLLLEEFRGNSCDTEAGEGS